MKKQILLLVFALLTFNSYANCTLTVNTSADTAICQGGTVFLSAYAGGGTQPYTYQWSSGQTVSSFYDSPLVTTTFTVTVTDANNCTVISSPIHIIVYPEPLTDFSPMLTWGNVPFNVCFTDLSTVSSGSIVEWSWNFGDGSPNDTTQNPCHVYTSVGTFDVSLFVSTSAGCSSTLSVPSVVETYPAGVNEINGQDYLLSIYPNPFTKQLKVEENKATFITLTDLSGKILLQQKTNAEQTVLNTEGLAAGLYFLRVGEENFKVVKE